MNESKVLSEFVIQHNKRNRPDRRTSTTLNSPIWMVVRSITRCRCTRIEVQARLARHQVACAAHRKKVINRLQVVLIAAVENETPDR